MIIMTNILRILLLFNISLSLTSISIGQILQQNSINDLHTVIDSIAVKNKIPGLAMGIVSQDTLISIYNYGFSNLNKKIKVNSNTKFRVGSITKSFLALGFLKLFEEGKLNLETPVKSIAPDLLFENEWEDTNPVCIVNLLEHTAGFDDVHFNDLSIVDISDLPLISAIRKQKKSMRVRWKPGSRYSYSSVGYTIAGYILEKVSGEKYEEFLKQQILDPLDMCESSFYFPKKNDKNISSGYESARELPSVFMNSRPAGSMISNVMDFSLFLVFMLQNGSINDKQIFKETSIRRMETSHSSLVAREGLKIGYGLGLPSYYKNGFLWQGHTGGGPGCLAKYAYCRELNTGYVFMINSFNMEAEKEIRDAIVDFITKNYKPIIKPSIELDKNTLDKYTGYYEPQNSRLELYAWISIIFDGINIITENDTLILKSFLGKETPLFPITESLFRESDEPDASAIFITTEDGENIFQKGNSYYIKTASWKPWLYRIIFILSILFITSIIIVAVIWIPLYLFRKFILKKTVSNNIKLILFPALAISSLLLGISVISDQTMVELTQRTNPNILFCISTYLFAAFSIAGFYLVIRDFKNSFKRPIKIYTTFASIAFIGFTIFLSYWGFIGLKLWSF